MAEEVSISVPVKRIRLNFNRATLQEAIDTPGILQAKAVAEAGKGNHRLLELWFARLCYSVKLKEMKDRYNPFVLYRRLKNPRTDWGEAFERTLAHLTEQPIVFEIINGSRS